MWNIRRGCLPFSEQLGIMTKQPPSAENQMTGKQQHDEPRGRPIDPSSETEEHTAEDRQLDDSVLHKGPDQQRSRATVSVHRSRLLVNEERESACCTPLSPVAMGKRRQDRPQMCVAVTDLPTPVNHPLLSAAGSVPTRARIRRFHRSAVRKLLRRDDGPARLASCIYFRLLLAGYFEGIDSERGIGWRAADSLALRDFIGLSLEDAPPDHSTMSRTRR